MSSLVKELELACRNPDMTVFELFTWSTACRSELSFPCRNPDMTVFELFTWVNNFTGKLQDGWMDCRNPDMTVLELFTHPVAEACAWSVTVAIPI